MVANCYIPFGQGLHVTQLGPDATLASACDSAAPVPCLGGGHTRHWICRRRARTLENLAGSHSAQLLCPLSSYLLIRWYFPCCLSHIDVCTDGSHYSLSPLSRYSASADRTCKLGFSLSSPLRPPTPHSWPVCCAVPFC